MSPSVKGPEGPPEAGPHVRWGGQSASRLRRRDRTSRRSGTGRNAFARGCTTRRATVTAPGQRHTDRRGERGSRPQNATLRLTISLQKSKGPSGRCSSAAERR
jgi:hypothetical protein